MAETKPVRVEKPWGHELIWAHTARYVGKILHIKQGHALSLQYHQQKDETVHVLTGRMRFQTGADGQARPGRRGGGRRSGPRAWPGRVVPNHASLAAPDNRRDRQRPPGSPGARARR